MSEALSILIADDDEGDRKNLRRILKKMPDTYNLCEVTSIDEAITATDQQEFDCAIVDYHMPGSDVLEGIKILHAKFPFMAIIMVTGQGDELIASNAFKSGVCDYMPKQTLNTETLKRSMMLSLSNVLMQKKIKQQHDALERYAHVLAHDLKAPIHQVQSFVARISQAIKAEEYEKINQYYSYLEKSTNSMVDLIDTLSEYNKVDQQEMKFELVSMNNVVSTAVNNLGSIIEENNAKITIDNEMPDIKGNETQLVQVLQNLIGNALKYCRNDVPSIEINAHKLEDAWEFSVKDNGIGIAEKDLNVIFDMFKRLHGKGGEFDGSGIGLATCYRIIQRHKGKIWCVSEENKGSVFFFTIPELVD